MTDVAIIPTVQSPAVQGATSGPQADPDASPFGDVLAEAVGEVESTEPDAPAADAEGAESLMAMTNPMAQAQLAAITQLVVPIDVSAKAQEEGASSVADVTVAPTVVGESATQAVPVTVQAMPNIQLAAGNEAVAAEQGQVTPEATTPPVVFSETTAAKAQTDVVRGEAAQMPVASTDQQAMPVELAVRMSQVKGWADQQKAQAVGTQVANTEAADISPAPTVTAQSETAAQQSGNVAAKSASKNDRVNPEAFFVASQPATDGGALARSTAARLTQVGAVALASADSRVVGAVQVDNQPAGDSLTDTGGESRWDGISLISRPESLQTNGVTTAAQTDGTAKPVAELPQRVIDQVVRAVTLNKSDGRTDMVLKLNPPDLGTLRLHMVQDAQGMSSQIQATSEQVRGLLQAHVPALMDALSGAGVRLNSVTITSDPSFGAMMHNSAQGGGQQQSDAPRRQYSGANSNLVSGLAGLADSAAPPGSSAGYSWLA